MRLHFMSDVHLELARWGYEPTEGDPPVADLVVLAGDTHTKHRGPAWAAGRWPDTPVVMIAGNHEFYGGSWTHEVAHMRRRALGTSVHVLEQESIDFPALGLRVAGATLWTNYAYLGDPEWSMRVAAAGMNDHRVIRYGKSALQPMHTLRRHERTVRWLAEEGERARRDGVPLLVVTHHPPVPEGLGPRQTEDRYARRLRASYVSDLAQLIAEVGAVSWIFGHTHVRRDFMVSGTRMLSNGRGYPNYDGPTPGFDPLLVVDPLRPTPVGKAITGTETSS